MPSHHTRPIIWLLLGLAGGLLLALAIYGWRETLTEAGVRPDWSMVLEQTVGLASGAEAIVVGEQFDEHWTVTVARWGLKGVFALAVLQSALLVFWRQVRQWRYRKVKGHHVFVGLGGHSSDLVLRALREGHQVAVVEADEHHPLRGTLEQAGALFVCGNPSDVVKLKAAGTSRATWVVIAAAGGEETSMTAAEAVAGMPSESGAGVARELLVVIESRETRELLNQRWSLVVHPQGWQTRIVSFRSVALRQIVTELALKMASSEVARQRGPRILVSATEDFTKDFLCAAIPFLQISGATLPEFWVLGAQAEAQAAFERLHPAAPLVAMVRFVTVDDSLAAVCSELAGQSFDAAVVHQDEQTRTLALGERLLRSPQFGVASVTAVMHHPPNLQLAADDRLHIVSLFEQGLKSPEFGDLTLECLARDNHEGYLAGLDKEEQAKAPAWDALGESFKESNRWAVLHRQIKRHIWEQTPDADRPAMLEHLTICEHQRWMGEKAMDGWRGGDQRDNTRRIHPDIQPFEILSDPVKEKDRVQVRKGLDQAQGPR
jgi:hypothetical protein